MLPPLDDELARAASEFDTLAELRADIEQRIREQIEEEVETAFRAAAVDALVEASNVAAARARSSSRARASCSTGSSARSSAAGISPETYLAVSEPDAASSSRSGCAPRPRARSRASSRSRPSPTRLGLEVTDDELEELVREQAEAEGETADEVVEQVFASGRHELLRDDLRLRKALDRVAAEVERDPASSSPRRARSSGRPTKEAAATETKLWTPGSKEQLT